MSGEGKAKNSWKQNQWQWSLLALPLGVFYLPFFHSTFQEDFLILAIFSYCILRSLNDRRISIPEDNQVIFLTPLLGVLYAVGWFGLLRGYLDTLGVWLIFYPLPLLIFWVISPTNPSSRSPSFRFWAASWALLTSFIFLTVAFFNWMVFPDILPNSPDKDFRLIPTLLVFPLIGCVGLAISRIPPVQRGRDHILLVILAGIAAIGVGIGDIKTWTIWYRAGESERSWTPFLYDDPIDIARAERKPYDAANLYNQVRERILLKGDIPRYLNWPFFMQYRMAVQFMRKKEPWNCASVLPHGDINEIRHMQYVKDLWHQELLWSMPNGEPDYQKNGRIWIDAELGNDRIYYCLDTWGRVYSIRNDRMWLEWGPPQLFHDAIDLEILDGVFIVLRSTGEILTSKPLKLFDTKIVFPLDRGNTIDIELFSYDSAAAVVNQYGEICLLGAVPKTFPTDETLRFDRPVIADMELEPYGNGYYLMDIYGAVHAKHAGGSPSIPITSPPVPKELLPYWTDLNMAIDLELDPQGRGLYVYNRLGELFTIAIHPYRETYRPEKTYPHRGVALIVNSDGSLFSLESNGKIVKIP